MTIIQGVRKELPDGEVEKFFWSQDILYRTAAIRKKGNSVATILEKYTCANHHTVQAVLHRPQGGQTSLIV